MSLFFLAIAAGFLTILAPCILPLLPVLLSTGAGGSKLRPLFTIAGFVGSFSIVGAALATAGAFLGITNENLRYLAVFLLLLFGAALLFPWVYDRLTVRIQPVLARIGSRVARGVVRKSDALSGIFVGVALGIVWTPCAGPILGTILTLAVKTKDFLTTMLLMFAYALGAGIPMLGVAYGGRALADRLKRIGAAQPLLNKIFGAFVIATALAILTGYDLVVQAYLVDFYPVRSWLKL